MEPMSQDIPVKCHHWALPFLRRPIKAVKLSQGMSKFKQEHGRIIIRLGSGCRVCFVVRNYMKMKRLEVRGDSRISDSELLQLGLDPGAL